LDILPYPWDLLILLQPPEPQGSSGPGACQPGPSLSRSNFIARVSSNTQDYQAQVDALKSAGCERIFSEKRSGKSAKDRPEFNKLKLDRLARSSRDLHNILHDLQTLPCGFVSLGEAWCDTTTDVGTLYRLGTLSKFRTLTASPAPAFFHRHSCKKTHPRAAGPMFPHRGPMFLLHSCFSGL
jgi:hypothetical protein